MEIIRGYKVELDLNNKQGTLLLQCAGTARWAWNWGLARRIEEYKETGKSSNAIEQHRQLNVLKKSDYSWLYSVSKAIPQEALRNLDKAYQNFFRRIKNGEKKVGFPKFKSRKRSIGRFRLTGIIRVEKDRIRLPRIGWLRLKEQSYIPTKGIHILSATVSEKAGRWFVSVQCREEIPDRKATDKPVGIDLGIKTLAVVSDGREFENPKALRKAQRRLKYLQRELARRKRSGQNWKKTKAKLNKQHARIVNIRRDALHKATSAIVAKSKPDSERPSAICIEDLNVSGMLKNHSLAQAISDAGMSEFRRQLEYKCKWFGIELVLADRFFPSSRLCRHCGCTNSELKLSDRTWICDCGVVLDRDFNAAINLRNWAIRRVPPEFTLVESDIRPAAVSLAASIETRTKPRTQSRF